jgi:hypothetical protein
MQQQNRQTSFFDYRTSSLIHQPQNMGEMSSLNFRPWNHFSQTEIIDVESTTIKKLDKKLNRCDNGTSY